MNVLGKSAPVQKTLVRNPEQPVPETIAVMPSKVSASSKIELNSACPTSSGNKIVENGALPKTRFNVPEMHSTLKLSKKIDEIVKPRRVKSLSDVDKGKLAVDEKVSRKMNFPYREKVFKDLIPLTNYEAKAQPSIVSRGPVYHKDKEPVLSDFLELRKPKVYDCKPRCPKLVEDKKTNSSMRNGLQLYKILLINEETSIGSV